MNQTTNLVKDRNWSTQKESMKKELTQKNVPKKPISITPIEAKKQTKQEILRIEKVRSILGKFLLSKLPYVVFYHGPVVLHECG